MTLHSAYLYMPGRTTPQLVKYSVSGGQAFREGDIALGPVATLNARYGSPRFANENQKSLLPSARSELWPNGEIPYEIDANVTHRDRQDIAWAVEQLSTTPLRLRPRVATDADYVAFTNQHDGCYSYLGRVGGRQEVHIGECGRGGPLHEVLHAAGFEHEHNRKDRDAYITMYTENTAPGCRHILEVSDSQPSTAYDADSIMHYASYACSSNGKPTMLKRNGQPIPDAERLTALDRAGIQSRYSATPTPTPVVPPQFPIPGIAQGSLPIPSWVPPGWIPPPPASTSTSTSTPTSPPPGLIPPGFDLPGWW